MRILAGDIGGTHTRLIVADILSGQRKILAEVFYPSQKYTSLIVIIHKFLASFDLSDSINVACIAVAGPVIEGSAAVTNLPWVVNEKELSEKFNIPKVKVINDFSAITYGISELKSSDTLTLQRGSLNDCLTTHPDAAVIGAGTGLGVSHRVWTGNQYLAYSSEAGHTGFAPENEQQRQLLEWLQSNSTHVSLEMLLSGRGIYTIYQFLHESSGLAESATVRTAMSQSDPAKIITEAALSNNDELSSKTIECFIDIYGAAAGNIALNYFPVGEVYIAGGIAAKISERLATSRFINAFISKGIMTKSLKKLPVKLITQEKVGLYGALIKAQSL